MIAFILSTIWFATLFMAIRNHQIECVANIRLAQLCKQSIPTLTFANHFFGIGKQFLILVVTPFITVCAMAFYAFKK